VGGGVPYKMGSSRVMSGRGCGGHVVEGGRGNTRLGWQLIVGLLVGVVLEVVKAVTMKMIIIVRG